MIIIGLPVDTFRWMAVLVKVNTCGVAFFKTLIEQLTRKSPHLRGTEVASHTHVSGKV